LQSQTAVVTGGTRGIGFEVAKTLVYGGARVIVVSRKLKSGRKAMHSISAGARDMSDHFGAVDLRFVECDFGDLHTVKTVADQLAQEEPRLDIVRRF
ncbi:NAD(P)-binding protein, partial [Exidia glandulosa HHB12029]